MPSTEYVYGTRHAVERLSELLRMAPTRHVRWAHFGDSQETSPGGAGFAFLNRLNFELVTRFTGGVTRESNIATAVSATGPWLCRSGVINTGTSTALPSNQILPNVQIRTCQLMEGTGANRADGFAHLLDFNGANSQAAAEIPSRSYVDNTATFDYEAFVVQASGAPDLRYRFYGHDTEAVDYFVDAATTDVEGTDGTGGIVKITLPNIICPTPETTPYLTIVLGSSSSETRVEVAGGRFINTGISGGINIQSFGVGGYHTDDLVDNHGSAGQMFNVMGPWDIVGMQYGTNDVYAASKSASEIMTDLKANIALIRSWATNDPLIIIISETPRIEGATARNDDADELVELQREYAASTPGVVMLDLRAVVENLSPPWTREAEQALWDLNDNNTACIYLNSSPNTDVVHYGDLAGRAAAIGIAQCLERSFSPALRITPARHRTARLG